MKLSVIGCGYVGLVTGACFAEIGHEVVCLDINKTKLKELSRGNIPFHERGLKKIVLNGIKNKRLSFSSSYKKASLSDIIFICVDTPMGSNGEPDLRNFYNVTDSLKQHFDSDKIIVIKSTVPLGTNKKLADYFNKYTLNKNYMISVCSNPEFLKEGDAVNDFMKPDRIVIGCDEENITLIINKLYKNLNIAKKKFIFMSPQSAELTKYASNSFLATKISFINEISRVADHIGADMHQVKDGMGSDERIGHDFLNAGLGFGGSCFPKDLAALNAYQRKNKISSGLLEQTVKVNSDQIKYFIKKIQNEYLLDLKNQRILVWGAAFKPNTDDLRESMSIKVVKKLSTLANHLYLYDPLCRKSKILKELKNLKNITVLDKKYSSDKRVKCLLICTEFDEFKELNFKLLNGYKIFDGRNILNRNKVEKNGIEYFGIGT